MLDTQPGRPPPRLRLHEHLVLAARRATSCSRRSQEAAGDDPDVNVRALRVPRRLRHRADGLGRRRVRRAARARATSRAAADRSRDAAGSGRRRAARPRPRRRASSRRPREASTRMSETDPLLNGHRRARAEHARRVRAPRRLRVAAQGAADARRSEVARRARGLGPARPRRRRLRHGQEGRRSCPRARWTSTSCCNADESEPGTFKDRELMQKNPHRLIEGIIIAAYAAGANRSFIYIRGEYAAAGRHPRRRAAPRPTRRGYLGRATSSAPGIRSRLVVHRGAGAYICGEETGAARLARGQARQPAPEAAVPRQPGPLPGPDADQQRRDAARPCRTSSRWAARSTRRSAPRTRPGTKLVSVSGTCSGPGNYEIELGMPSREIIYGLAGGPPDGPRDQAAGSRAARRSPVLTGGRPRPAVRLRLDGQGRLDARLRRDHRRRRLELGRRRRAEAREVLRARVLRQVHAVPRGHELDREDARAHRGRARPRRWTSTSWPRSRSSIIGNCLCVLGDAMAMPVGSMIAKFRDEFEAHIEAARERATPTATTRPTSSPRRPRARPPSHAMPRPNPRSSPSRSTAARSQAPENSMLVDAAKHGDVEIPVFCYEPKLGPPVGACRMCLVEIEGIPKLQTGCSTPVKDGMVVHTQTDRVKEAQEAVVEFLLDQPPARLPGLRQGRRVPAAGHLLRLGRRHLALHRAQAPLREAARALAADRDRPRALHPLLPLRALHARRSPRTTSSSSRSAARTPSSRPSTGIPYVAPFSGNIIELCPVGALTSQPLPLPRAAVGHRGRGLGLHAVPGAVQRRAHRPRRARPARARARPRRGRRRLALRQAAASPTRRSTSTSASPQPMLRDGGELRAGRAGSARSTPPRRRWRAQARPRRRAGGRRHDQRGGLPPAAPAARGPRLAAPRLARAGALAAEPAGARSRSPSLQATVPDLEFAHAVLVLDCEPVDDMPILDLRDPQGRPPQRRQAGGRVQPPRRRWTPTRCGRALRAGRRRGVRRGRSRRAGRRRRARRARAGRRLDRRTTVARARGPAARRRRGRRRSSGASA